VSGREGRRRGECGPRGSGSRREADCWGPCAVKGGRDGRKEDGMGKYENACVREAVAV